MKRSTRSLRILSALCLALLLRAAIPHLHEAADARPTPSTRALEIALGADGDARLAELSADERHESHSSTRAGDEHPCTLCRSPQGRLLAVPAPAPFALDVVVAPAVAPPAPLARAEERFARRHPARAPPVA